MPIAKTQIPTATLKSSLDTLQKAIDKATKADGKVDVKKLETELKTADPGAKLGLAAIADAFVRERTYSSGGGCGSSGSTHTVHEKPDTLAPKEVKTVLSALLAARAKVEAFDTNKADGTKGKDKKISQHEAAAAGGIAGTGLAAEIALAALQGAEANALKGGKLGDQLTSLLSRASAALENTMGRDGSVTMTTLEAAFGRIPEGIDHGALFDAISSTYERTRTVSYGGGGCGSSGGTRTERSAPTKLTKAEAGEVVGAFAQAVQLLTDAGVLGGAKLAKVISDAKATGPLVGAFMEVAVEPHLPPPPPAPTYSRSGC